MNTRSDMLIQSSLPGSIEAALSFLSDDRKPDLLCDWIPRDETWLNCQKGDELPKDSCRELISTEEANDCAAGSSSLVLSPACYKLSSISNMCASSTPNLVYKRRKLQRNSVALLSAQETNSKKGSGGCPSNISSKDDSFESQTKKKTEITGAPVLSSGVHNGDLKCNGSTSTFGQIHRHNPDVNYYTRIKKKGVKPVSKSDSIDGHSSGKEHQFDEALDRKSSLESSNGNDSVSSSKSKLELGSSSMKTDMDDTGECSSSGLLSDESISEKERCISLLRSHGLLEGVSPIKSCAQIDGLGVKADKHCSQLCKSCGQSENPVNMLICDNCEGAFHVSCCNPKIKKIPIQEWYCHPCLRKKHMFTMESLTKKSFNIKCERSKCRNKASESEPSLLEFMLKDTEAYKTEVRIGKGFQADIPEWCGPVSEEYDCFGEPLDIDPQECGSLNERNTNRLSTTAVGNWLQCREVLDDGLLGENAEGTICGKWRRAPLFEVQTDDWDCSCSVLWDPIHADCAVPQLRPRLGGKKPKFDCSQNNTKDVKTVALKDGDT
ncbi:hypothetical protein IFM89_006832 [Coptis chinensis]|uniref:Uncharacterized protein n=1 Tax=Coptis chinensis TaxID=261450 RepID=A0A835IAQ7_9MAGN|nr:hypothetical protein IFM89_006832 [Coptis chinensis]